MHRTIPVDAKFVELNLPIHILYNKEGADEYPLIHPANIGKSLPISLSYPKG
jgi:hypothetical protein